MILVCSKIKKRISPKEYLEVVNKCEQLRKTVSVLHCKFACLEGPLADAFESPSNKCDFCEAMRDEVEALCGQLYLSTVCLREQRPYAEYEAALKEEPLSPAPLNAGHARLVNADLA